MKANIILIILLSSMLAACLPLAGSPLSVSTATLTPPAKAAILTPFPTGAIAPAYAETQIAVQREYLAWQKEVDSRNARAQAALATMGASNEGTKTAAQVSSLQTQTSEQVKVSETMTALEAARQQIPIDASRTAIAQDARQREIDLAAAQAALDASATEEQRKADSYSATATNAVIVSTVAAPYTATVEASRRIEATNRQRLGTSLLQAAGWSAVIAFAMALLGIAIVIVIARWNRTAAEANQSSVLKDGDGNLWQFTSAGLEKVFNPDHAGAPVKAPPGVPPVKPVPPIYDHKHPAPTLVRPLNADEQRIYDILRRSEEIYGAHDATNRIAGWEKTTGSGTMWDIAIKQLREALQDTGADVVATNRGTFLRGVSRADLIYDLEMGDIQLPSPADVSPKS